MLLARKASHLFFFVSRQIDTNIANDIYVGFIEHPCGTLGYTAPEVVKGEPYELNCDVWSLGVCLFVMLVGFAPFEGDTQPELRDLIVAGEYSMDAREWTKITKEGKDIIPNLLS